MIRRFLFIIGLSLCFVSASWASSKIDYRYWFDNDSLAINSGHSAANAWQMKVDVSGLSEAIHTIHLQAIDKDGAASTPVTRYFLKTSMSSKPVKVVYSIDDALAPLATSTVTNGTVLLNVSQLPDGFHYLHVQAIGSQVSPCKTYCFIKTPIKDPNVQLNCLCWIDGNLYKNEKLPANGGIISWELDVTDLPQGMHYLQVQSMSDDGIASKVYQSFFMRVPTETEIGSLNCICRIDGKLFKQEKMSVQGGIIHWNLDVNELPQGLHYAQIQVMDDNGTSSRNYQSFFLRVPTTEERGNLNCICWIDGDIIKKERLPISGGVLNWSLDVKDIPQGLHYVQVLAQDDNGISSHAFQSFFVRVPTSDEIGKLNCYYGIDGDDRGLLARDLTDGAYQFNIDVSDLEDGPHRITCMLTNDNGNGSGISVFNRYFIKVPKGGYGVKHYNYWLNDSISEAVDVSLDQPTNPFSLISLIPFDHWPIRSSCFEFKVEDGQPIIYAQNDMHVRFYDASDRYIEVTRTFTDPVIKEEVNEFTLLQPGETKTAPRPAKDEILWYMVNAEEGDSISFKANRACTIQVFSPSGEELNSSSADKSVTWNGAYATVGGTYYVAQHDMTATQGNTLSITYQHIDKFALLDCDVHTLGNGGASNIKFYGNGFDYLDSICLVNGNEVIREYSTYHISNSIVDVMFDLTDCQLGKYSVVGYFDNEIYTIPNAITVGSPDSIRLSLNVRYPREFLRGSTSNYTIEVTNHGNSTAYQVPLEIQISSDGPHDIHKLIFSDNVPKVNPEWLDDIDDSDEYKSRILDYLRTEGDMLHFFNYYDSIQNKYIKDAHLLLDVPAKSTITISLSILAGNSFDLYAQTHEDWDFYIPTSNYANHRAPRRSKEGACCVREHVECITDVVVDILGYFAIIPNLKIADCAATVGNIAFKFGYDVWCGEEHGGKKPGQSIKDMKVEIVNAIIGCIMGKLIPGDEITPGKAAFWAYQHIYDVISTATECVKAFSQRIPNCPPVPPGGGSSNPVEPCEPNEMLGYTAPSGSHYIGNGITDVYYTICFENDSAATAPANVIILTDTIDGRVHDLNTFAPTRVKIGDVEAMLSGEPNFIQTVDMRPRINCIAQVQCNYDSQKGIAVFTLTSLDPMTMEPVSDFHQGMLPPNDIDNQGQGEMSFNISLKPGLPEGTVIKNHADNIFDNEDPVFTPDWVNIIDGVKPTSRVIGCELLNDSIAAVSIRGEDDRSGPWRYDIYTQYGGGDWVKAASEVPIDHAAQVRVYEGIEHQFYAVLTDSAGNVESKQPICELTFDYFSSDSESNLTLNLARGWNWMSHNLNAPLSIDCLKPNAHRILSHDGETINDPRYGYTGNVSQMSPTELYKVEMSASDNIPLSGLLFNSALKPIPLVQGWNWMGYPMPGAMSVNEALVLLEADENDCIVGQDGSAVYNDGLWRGTLTTLEPGKGYLLKVNNDKSLRFNASRSSVRLHAPAVTGQNEELPWTVDIHRYPNVTPIIADLWDGNTLTSSLGYALAAFVDDECRGIATEVNGRWMMNVFGNGGETVTFKALDRNTGLVHDVTETQSFTADLLGTMAMPVQLHIADGAGLNNVTYDDVNVKPTMTTGPVTIEASVTIDDVEVINMAGMTIMGYSNIPSGFTLDLSSEPDGVYLVKVHTGSHISTVKVMKRSR